MTISRSRPPSAPVRPRRRGRSTPPPAAPAGGGALGVLAPPHLASFEHLDAADARFAAAQTRHGLGGTLYALPHARYVNHPLRNYAAEHKPLQLATAQRMGLPIPPTLVSNNLDDIKAFLTEHEQVVYKALRWTPYRQQDGTGLTTWTEPVSIDELDESVAVVPHLFQARIRKEADMRVVVVGERVFAVRIDCDLLDWRRDYSVLSYRVTTLPDQISDLLVRYLRRFGLASGSFDLVLDCDGDLHFLELNPNGQWGWLEDAADLPLTSAFADLLAQGEP